MIEVVAERLIDLLKRDLPSYLSKMQLFFTTYDTTKFKRVIELKAPKDSSYIFGEINSRNSSGELPQIYIIPMEEKFLNGDNVAKGIIQFYTLWFKIGIYIGSDHKTEYNEILTRSLIRFTDCVVSVIRANYNLIGINGEPFLTKKVGIDSVKYNQIYPKDNRFLKSSEFNLSYLISDNLKNSYLLS